MGKKYARVTDVIRPFSKLEHIDPDTLANKCRIGTNVHKAIEDDIRETFPMLDGDCVGYFKSYVKWKGCVNPTFVDSEKRYFCHDKMITGQIDGLVRFPHATSLVLVDFKTSAQECKETWNMQAHLYGYLLGVNGVITSPRFLFIKLSKRGDFPKVFDYKYCENTHRKCMDAVDQFWQYQKEMDNFF